MSKAMRSTKMLLRLGLLGLLVLAWASPATAVVRSENRTPNAARQSVSHRSQSAGTDVGQLRIPAIGLTEKVRSGVAMSVIDQGVAHWSGTSTPGGSGNIVLAGHRSTKTRPFQDIGELSHGDLIYMTGPDGTEIMYRVSDSYIVEPKDIWITYDGPKASLTMFACHPKGSARYRIVVTAEPVANTWIG
jgi:sortase A